MEIATAQKLIRTLQKINSPAGFDGEGDTVGVCCVGIGAVMVVRIIDDMNETFELAVKLEVEVMLDGELVTFKVEIVLERVVV